MGRKSVVIIERDGGVLNVWSCHQELELISELLNVQTPLYPNLSCMHACIGISMPQALLIINDQLLYVDLLLASNYKLGSFAKKFSGCLL